MGTAPRRHWPQGSSDGRDLDNVSSVLRNGKLSFYLELEIKYKYFSTELCILQPQTFSKSLRLRRQEVDIQVSWGRNTGPAAMRRKQGSPCAPLPRGSACPRRALGSHHPPATTPGHRAAPVGGWVEGLRGTSTGVCSRGTMRAKLPCEGPGRESDPAGQWDCLCFCGRRLGKCQAGRKGRNLQARKKFPLLWVVSWGHGLHGLNSCVRRSCLNTSSERAGCVRQSFLPQDHWTTSRAHPHGQQPVAPGSPLGCHPPLILLASPVCSLAHQASVAENQGWFLQGKTTVRDVSPPDTGQVHQDSFPHFLDGTWYMLGPEPKVPRKSTPTTRLRHVPG